jgi:MFS family permease
MSNILRSYSSLDIATLLMVLASGVLTTYLGLRLAADSAAQIWIGGMMSAYYLGLVAGSKIGHKLIARVGHIRAFVASAGITTASALGHALIDDLAIWLVLRLMIGISLTVVFVLGESWINQLVEDRLRGRLVALYGTGFALSQLCGPLLLALLGTEGNLGFWFSVALLLGGCILLLGRDGAPQVIQARGGAALSLTNGVINAGTNHCFQIDEPATLAALIGVDSVVGDCPTGNIARGGAGVTNDQALAAVNGGTNNNFAFAITLTNNVVNGAGETGRTAFNANTRSTFFPTRTFIGAIQNAGALTTIFGNWTCNSSIQNFASTTGACTSLPVYPA